MSGKKKIVIFGGGIAGLTTAYNLTEGALRDKHDVTVYQMGWRVGGKGASGRNLQDHDRIEEHGLHIWLGCYENAFRMMRKCYDECKAEGLLKGSPFQHVKDAFEEQHVITMMEPEGDTWKQWPLRMPPTSKFPGEQTQCLSVVGAIKSLLRLVNGLDPNIEEMIADRKTIRQAYRISKKLKEDRFDRNKPVGESLLVKLEELDLRRRTGLEKNVDFLSKDNERRKGLLIELAMTLAKGVIKDVLLRGHSSFDVVDHMDFRQWLKRHGASKEARESSPVRAAYEIVFGYEKGISGRHSYAAGVAIRFMLRWVLTYEGALIYKMRAGMGDIVFSPLYLALRNRGVKFNFFHALNQVVLSDGKSDVEKILVDQQVTLPNGDYDPITWVKGVPCWPSEPLYVNDDGVRQIPETEELAVKKLQSDHPGLEPLESAYSPLEPVETKTLIKDRDFDTVVLAMGLGAFPIHCKELLENSPVMNRMVNSIPTVGTQSFQLWLSKSAEEMGFHGEPTILDSYLDSLADFSHLTSVESHGGDVKNIAYFSRAIPEPDAPPPIGPNAAYPANKTSEVKRSQRDWFLNGEHGMRPIWPKAYDDGEGNFKWEWLVDPNGGQGQERFDAQFWCANVNPSDRYIQSLAGTTEFRIHCNESGFKNVILTGDWIRTGLNVGCIESATVGGLQASRAICGTPEFISGENDFCAHTAGLIGCLFKLLMPIFAFIAWIRRWLWPPEIPQPRRLTQTPNYIERGGEQSYSQPYEFKSVNAFVFRLEASRTKLQQLVDKQLNVLGEDHVAYIPITSSVLISFCDIAKSRPTVGPAKNFGWIAEKDVAIWIPLLAVDRSSNSILPRGIVWHLPYVFVDQAWALSSGREIYGFPKAMSTIKMPGSASAGSEFSVNAPAVLVPDSQQMVPNLDILKIIATGGEGDAGLLKAEREKQEIIDEMKLKIFGEDKSRSFAMLDNTEVPYSIDQHLDLTDLTLVFLKQIRDIRQGTTAAYQGICEADARPSNFAGAGRLSGSFELKAIDGLTHPLRSDFGWSDPQPILDAWCLNFDFTMQAGHEIISNTIPR